MTDPVTENGTASHFTLSILQAGVKTRAKKFVKQSPLWFKITLALTAALVVVALTAGELMRRQLQVDYAQSLHGTSENTFMLLSAAALEPVISEDIPLLHSIVHEAGRIQPDIHALRVHNEDGLLLASWSRDTADDAHRLVSFSKDLHFEGELFGALSIDWSTQRLDQEVERQVSRIRYSVAAALVLLTLIIILLIHVFAVRPISKIHGHLLSLTQGDLKSRVRIHSSRELSLLGASVNELAKILELQKVREQELETARRELFEAKELAEITLHSIGDGVIATDALGKVQYINPISEQLMGWSNAEVSGRPVEEVFRIVDELTREPQPNTIRRCLETGGIVTADRNTVLLSRSGLESAIEDSASPIRNRNAEIVGAVMVYHDVTQARNMAHKLHYQATHDALTGLVNRNEFANLLYQYRQESTQKTQEHALLYVDLDQFKVVNDTCGHASGDALLQQLTQLIGDRLRRGDVFARLGGDEFGILLNDCPLQFAIRIAESVRETVEQFRFVWKDKSFTVGASIGLVPITVGSPEAEILLTQADEACYTAKEKGRNRLHVFTVDDYSLRTRRNEMGWLAKIDAALAEDRLVLYQQAILPLRQSTADRGIHFEVLLRLAEPDGTLVPPGAFIPAAERYGIMSKIDRWVVGHTLEWLRLQSEKAEDLGLCTINLSGYSLSDDNLLNYISELMGYPDIDPQKICFELTETAAVANLAQALNFIRRLKQKGCLFALDDFGSGMSSFCYLKNLPVDFLKIDGMFVKDIIHDKMSFAMVKSINEVGHVMGKRTIAELVENKEILKRLEHIGVDFVQGNGIAEPEPLE